MGTRLCPKWLVTYIHHVPSRISIWLGWQSQLYSSFHIDILITKCPTFKLISSQTKVGFPTNVHLLTSGTKVHAILMRCGYRDVFKWFSEKPTVTRTLHFICHSKRRQSNFYERIENFWPLGLSSQQYNQHVSTIDRFHEQSNVVTSSPSVEKVTAQVQSS